MLHVHPSLRVTLIHQGEPVKVLVPGDQQRRTTRLVRLLEFVLYQPKVRQLRPESIEMDPLFGEIEVGKEQVDQRMTQTQHPMVSWKGWKGQGEEENEHYQCRLHPPQGTIESVLWIEPQVSQKQKEVLHLHRQSRKD